MVSVGFVGVGGIAKAHLNNLMGIEGVRIAAVTDVDSAKVEQAAAKYGAKGFPGIHEMLDGADLDAVYICIPPFAHGEAEEAALDRRIPFYVEKPLGIDPKLPERIAERVRETGLVTAVGFQLRYLPSVEKAKSALDGRTLGLVSGRYACPFVPTPWWRKQALSGGQLVEQAIHVVDLIRYLAGEEIKSVYSQAALRIHTDVEDLDIRDVTATTLTFESGAVGTLSNTFALPAGSRVEVNVVAKGLEVHWTPKGLEVTDADGRRDVEVKDGDPMAAADRAFIAAVSGSGDGIRSDYADALKTHRVVMAALESARSGRPVQVR